MDAAIKKGFSKVKKEVSKEEKSLIKKDVKRDKMCDMKMKKKK